MAGRLGDRGLGMQQPHAGSRRLILGAMLAAGLLAAAGPARAQIQLSLPSLAAEMVRLPDVTVVPDKAVVNVAVALQGDVPGRTFVVARQAEDNRWRTRSADGFWWLWDNLPHTVLDTGAKAEGDVLTLKVFNETLADVRLPLEVVVGYDTAQGRKTGYFMVRAAR